MLNYRTLNQGSKSKNTLTDTKMNMRTKPFEGILQTGSCYAPSNWGAYSF